MASEGERDESSEREEQQAQPQQQATSTRVFYLGPAIRLEVECVEIFRGKLLGGGVDATGQMLWPGSLVLCKYLLQAHTLLQGSTTDALPPALMPPFRHATDGVEQPQCQQPQHQQPHIVELGAGATGLAGLLWARLQAPHANKMKVTLTDRDAPSLALLQRNAARVNRECGDDVVAARALSWGIEAEAEAIMAERGPAALVLGADILYPAIEVATIGALLWTARRLLGGGAGKGSMLLSFIDRDQKGSLRNLLRALRAGAFLLERAWELPEAGDEKGDDQMLRLEEEEEEEQDEDKGNQQQQQQQQRTGRRRRRPVILMRGAKLLLLAPMVPGDPCNQEKQEAAEMRWLPGVWDEPAARGGDDSDAEWAPPFRSSDGED